MNKKESMKTATKKRGGAYLEVMGRRKLANARVRIEKAAKTDITVNKKPYTEYFTTEEMQTIVREPLGRIEGGEKFVVSVHVKGGGIHGQAEAVRHGIARALSQYGTEHRSVLKKLGYLTRDARMKERRKFGLKKARRAPQWSKR